MGCEVGVRHFFSTATRGGALRWHFRIPPATLTPSHKSPVKRGLRAVSSQVKAFDVIIKALSKSLSSSPAFLCALKENNRLLPLNRHCLFSLGAQSQAEAGASPERGARPMQWGGQDPGGGPPGGGGSSRGSSGYGAFGSPLPRPSPTCAPPTCLAGPTRHLGEGPSLCPQPLKGRAQHKTSPLAAPPGPSPPPRPCLC